MACVITYVVNYGLGVVGPEIAMNFGSTKWNRYLVRGLPTDSPLHRCGAVKNSLGLLVGPKWSMCVVSKILLKMNGLECVWKEIVNALKFSVLT